MPGKCSELQKFIETGCAQKLILNEQIYVTSLCFLNISYFFLMKYSYLKLYYPMHPSFILGCNVRYLATVSDKSGDHSEALIS